LKYWEIIADNLSKAGWSWSCVLAVDRDGRTIWIADAHRGDGKRFVVHADEKLTVFLELESAVGAASGSNDPSSATAATRCADRKRDTPPPFNLWPSQFVALFVAEVIALLPASRGSASVLWPCSRDVLTLTAHESLQHAA
jgi:hypothetical protein